jgi:hypothetical protein
VIYAKSGASKQSSSFLKATTMTLFTISESEKASHVDQIHSFLGDDPFLKQFLPIDPATTDLLNLVKMHHVRDSDGERGALLPFTSRHDADLFSHLEMPLRQDHPPVCGRNHMAYRSTYFPVKVTLLIVSFDYSFSKPI